MTGTEVTETTTDADAPVVRDDDGGTAGLLVGMLLVAIVLAGVIGMVRAARARRP